MRERLYETTMAFFRERGFEATRIKDVIEKLGVSEATFFNYFPTKEAVLHHSAEQAKYFYGVLLEHLLARDDEPAIDRLRELSDTMAAVYLADREFMATIVSRTSLFVGATGAARDNDLENYRRLASLFRQGQQRGEVDTDRDPIQLAELFMAIHTLTVTNWVTRYWGDVGSLEPRLAVALDVLLNGCSGQVHA